MPADVKYLINMSPKSKNIKNGKSNPFVIQEGKMRAGQLKGFSYRKSWTEDSLLANGNQGETVGKTFNAFRLKPMAVIIFLFLFLLLGRVAWLQIIKGSYYYSLAEGNRIRIERIEAKRGVIYDRNKNLLAGNTANFLLYLIPADLPNDESEKDKTVNRLNEILPAISPADLKQKLAGIKSGSLESYQPLFIADNIEYDKAMLLYLESEYMPGVVLSNQDRREYDRYDSLSLSHVLGYTGKINEEELEKFGSEYLPIDYIGKTGIEYFWENELRGKNGSKHIEVDALGKEKKVISNVPAEDGRNLVLSLDIELQKKTEEIVSAHLNQLDLSKAAVVAMNPENGEILSLVSLPAYDNNVFARGITADEYSELENNPDNPFINRAIAGEYPSGSTIKPIIAAAALEEGIIDERTTINSTGGLRIGQWFFPDWKAGGHGLVSVRQALAWSINTFFYFIGGGYENFKGLGVDRIVNYARSFGLGAQTGIDLSGEASGFLPTQEWKEKTKGEPWYIGDTYHLAIGQGDVLVTPLQVADYTSVFANGGKLYRPHLVKQVLTGNDKPVGDVENKPIRENFIDSHNIEIVRQGMRQTVTSGSAQSLQAVPVAVAGKTGTAQWSSKENPHSWFTGFSPYDNPQIVITVLVEKGGEGSDIAVPIAREILEWYFGERAK